MRLEVKAVEVPGRLMVSRVRRGENVEASSVRVVTMEVDGLTFESGGPFSHSAKNLD